MVEEARRARGFQSQHTAQTGQHSLNVPPRTFPSLLSSATCTASAIRASPRPPGRGRRRWAASHTTSSGAAMSKLSRRAGPAPPSATRPEFEHDRRLPRDRAGTAVNGRKAVGPPLESRTRPWPSWAEGAADRGRRPSRLFGESQAQPYRPRGFRRAFKRARGPGTSGGKNRPFHSR